MSQHELSPQESQRMLELTQEASHQIFQYAYAMVVTTLSEKFSSLNLSIDGVRLPNTSDLQSRVADVAYQMEITLMEHGFSEAQCRLYKRELYTAVHEGLHLERDNLRGADEALRVALEVSTPSQATEPEAKLWRARIFNTPNSEGPSR